MDARWEEQILTIAHLFNNAPIIVSLRAFIIKQKHGYSITQCLLMILQEVTTHAIMLPHKSTGLLRVLSVIINVVITQILILLNSRQFDFSRFPALGFCSIIVKEIVVIVKNRTKFSDTIK